MTFALVIVVLLALGIAQRLLDRDNFAHWSVTVSLKKGHQKTLARHFKFYQVLPKKSQKIFEYRVAKFMILKDYIPRQMESVTEEMKVLIAASAIQLTFGFPRVFLSYFKYIIVYPDQFFSTTAQRYHKGEVNPKAKAIVLSWRHFTEGYAQAEGQNLGLHEMAHALELENKVMNHEYDFLDSDAIDAWQRLAALEIKKLREGGGSIFREYGGTNHHEFFAVTVEYFFERPGDFMDYHRDLYRAMANLLRQDPIRLYSKI